MGQEDLASHSESDAEDDAEDDSESDTEIAHTNFIYTIHASDED